MTYPANIEQKIDFPVIREQLHKACSSALGRREVDDMEFLTDYQAILHRLREAEEMVHVLSDASLNFPRGEINDLRESLNRVRIEGLYMDETELFQLRKSIDYAAQLERFFLGLDPVRFPQLRTFPTRHLHNLSGETTASILQPLISVIDKAIDLFGQLRDSASPELHRIRRELSQAQGAVSASIAAILRRAQAAGLVDKEATPTLREGRLVLPIPAGVKKKIGGIVHDESATGKTVFIEPQEVVEANNRIRSLESEQARERLRILHEITAFVRPLIPQILLTQGFLAHVDFIIAKALVAKRLHAIAPHFVDYPMLDLREARHAVLYLRFSEEGKSVVPLTMKLENEANRILVISGPNAGGKSVCLKTVALCQYMLQCGLPVPVSEASTMGLFDRLMIDIGDEQSIEDDLSTYSSHLRNMKAFVKYADNKTLFLIDEFGTGTEPLIGGAIAESVLTNLNMQAAFGVVTTHYTNLKHFAEQAEGVVNGAMLYDRGQLKPLFQLSIGQAGSSFAIEIAKQTGLPDDIIKRATDLVGEKHIDYDKQLQDIARDKRYWENKRQNIRQREKHLEEKIAYYENEIAGLKAKKKAVLQEAKEEAADILAKSNATIERTIREIKEAKADKTKTQAARAKVEKLKQQVEPTKKERQAAKNRVLRDFRELKPMAKSMPSSQPFVVNTIRQHKLAFEHTLDIRGLRADEALETFIAYLDDAIMVNAGTVTILHGTGTGALKQIVRDHLAQRNKDLRKRKATEIVYHDGDPDRGGAGLTIVEL